MTARDLGDAIRPDRGADCRWSASCRNGRRSWGSFLLSVLAFAAGAHGGDGHAVLPPNVVVIVSDDAGYADFSMHGSVDVETPRIDSIAANGVRFTQGYVTASVCSPSRAGLLTGRYQQRFGHEFNVPPRYSELNGLSIDERTLADHLGDAGYRSIAIGKWHLGYADQFHPLNRGFDEHYGFLQGARPYWPMQGSRLNRLLRDGEPVEESFEYLTDELGAEAARFIERSWDRPFFVYLAFNAVHTPMHAFRSDLDASGVGENPSRREQLVAMTRALDRSVGRVLDALDAVGVAERTLVVFVNDNGGARNNGSDNGTLRGTKSTPYEGGIRVPFAMSWPGRLPAGTIHDAPVSTLDIVPTALRAAGVTDPAIFESLDGVDLMPRFEPGGSAPESRTLFWRRGTRWAVRDGDLKLVHHDPDGTGLFDLADDPGESRDLSVDRPQEVARLKSLHETWSSQLASPRWRSRGSPAMRDGRSVRDRPNVLWIVAEDLGPDLACYGTRGVRTPNLDRLASEGVRFTHAFATAPVCSSSRSALMTGMHQTSIGAHNHRSHRDDDHRLPDGVHLLTHRLQDAGYFTANIRELSDDRTDRFFRGTGKTDWNFRVDGPAFDSDRWNDLKPNQPFYAQVNFPETHRGRAWSEAPARLETPADPEGIDVPPYYPDHPLVRRDWASYLDALMALDRKVGFVLERLQQDGLAGNTVVVFLADHGRAMVRGKQWCYDSGLRVPLIVRWPAIGGRPEDFKPGTVDERLVSTVDLAATTLDIAGIEVPEAMHGRPLFGPEAGLDREVVFGARDRCDETVMRIRTVRDRSHRYIRNAFPGRPFLELNRYKEWSYPVLGLMRRLHADGELEPLPAVLMAPGRPAEELYDLTVDPHETVNLVGDPGARRTLERMRRVLDEWIEATVDQGQIPESPEVVEFWTDRMRRTYDERLRRRDGAVKRLDKEDQSRPSDEGDASRF